jgi:hypothetical protein
MRKSLIVLVMVLALMLGGCQKQAAHNSAVQEPVKVFLLVDEVESMTVPLTRPPCRGWKKPKRNWVCKPGLKFAKALLSILPISKHWSRNNLI